MSDGGMGYFIGAWMVLVLSLIIVPEYLSHQKRKKQKLRDEQYRQWRLNRTGTSAINAPFSDGFTGKFSRTSQSSNQENQN